MSFLPPKNIIIALAFTLSVCLLNFSWGEEASKSSVPSERSESCVACHEGLTPGIVSQWEGSKHAQRGIGCFECHQSEAGYADAFDHYGSLIATVVTPRDCARCHPREAEEFQRSHHAAGGDILASLDNFLAETVEGSKESFLPFSPTPGLIVDQVNGMASAYSGCQQCHGSKLALLAKDGGMINVDTLKPGPDGKPTHPEVLKQVAEDSTGKPLYHPSTWPNTGIGRLNLDGSRGSCTACHSRHDFSARRARQPENCGKCHLGPDHPQKEIYEESKHGIAYRDLKDKMNLDSDRWVLGEDYSAAPTCATCHLSAHTRNDNKITHDPGERISWTNRSPISLMNDTDAEGKLVKESDPAIRDKITKDSAMAKRDRMVAVCTHCHTSDYVGAFYKQYDDLVVLYNEKFAKPGKKIMDTLYEQELLTKTAFDHEIKWTWFYLWHHEGRRARHGASMMAPDYTHWHGMYEVADRFYMQLIPEARKMAAHAAEEGKTEEANAVNRVIDEILARPEHTWFKEGAENRTSEIRRRMQQRYGGEHR